MKYVFIFLLSNLVTFNAFSFENGYYGVFNFDFEFKSENNGKELVEGKRSWGEFRYAETCLGNTPVMKASGNYYSAIFLTEAGIDDNCSYPIKPNSEGDFKTNLFHIGKVLPCPKEICELGSQNVRNELKEKFKFNSESSLMVHVFDQGYVIISGMIERNDPGAIYEHHLGGHTILTRVELGVNLHSTIEKLIGDFKSKLDLYLPEEAKRDFRPISPLYDDTDEEED